MHDGQLYECMVDGGKLVRGARLDAEASAYVERYWPFIAEDGRFEIAFEALDLDRSHRAKHSLRSPTIGLCAADRLRLHHRGNARFPQGTLMSYRRHRATPLVLENPGEQDITAHVPFDAVMDRAAAGGLETVRMETLAQLGFALRGARTIAHLHANFQKTMQDAYVWDGGDVPLPAFSKGGSERGLRQGPKIRKAPIARGRVESKWRP